MLETEVNDRDRAVKQLYLNLPANKTGFAYFLHPDVPPMAVTLAKWDYPVQYMDIVDFKFYEKEIRMEHYSSMSSEEVPCVEDPSYPTMRY